MGLLPELAAAQTSFAAPVDGFDLSLRLTSRTIGTPLAAIVDDTSAAIAAFAAGARLIELGSVDGALRTSIVLDLIRASGKVSEDASFGAALLVVRLPEVREAAEAMLDEMSASSGTRLDLAAQLTPEQANSLGTTRPLTAVTLATTLDDGGEAFARAIMKDWGDDVVISLPASASPVTIAPALDRLRSTAESAGCTFVIRAPVNAPAALLAALSVSVAEGMPVWLTGVSDVPAALSRGASLVSAARDVAATFRAVVDPARRLATKRVSDWVLFGPDPDAAIRAAAEAQFGAETWLVAPVKNSVLALMKLTEIRGGAKLDSALTRESLAHPPKECCLYKDEQPDLKEAATGWFYDRWVRETMRRRLAVG